MLTVHGGMFTITALNQYVHKSTVQVVNFEGIKFRVLFEKFLIL